MIAFFIKLTFLQNKMDQKWLWVIYGKMPPSRIILFTVLTDIVYNSISNGHFYLVRLHNIIIYSHIVIIITLILFPFISIVYTFPLECNQRHKVSNASWHIPKIIYKKKHRNKRNVSSQTIYIEKALRNV